MLNTGFFSLVFQRVGEGTPALFRHFFGEPLAFQQPSGVEVFGGYTIMGGDDTPGEAVVGLDSSFCFPPLHFGVSRNLFATRRGSFLGAGDFALGAFDKAPVYCPSRYVLSGR